jgi:hypothetical protein
LLAESGRLLSWYKRLEQAHLEEFAGGFCAVRLIRTPM